MAEQQTLTRKDKLEQALQLLDPKQRERIEARLKRIGAYEILDQKQAEDDRKALEKQEKEEAKKYKQAVRGTGIKALTFEEELNRIQKARKKTYEKAHADMVKTTPQRYDIKRDAQGPYFEALDENDKIVKERISDADASFYELSNEVASQQMAEKVAALKAARQGVDPTHKDYKSPQDEARDRVIQAIRARELGEFEKQEAEFSKEFPETDPTELNKRLSMYDGEPYENLPDAVKSQMSKKFYSALPTENKKQYINWFVQNAAKQRKEPVETPPELIAEKKTETKKTKRSKRSDGQSQKTKTKTKVKVAGPETPELASYKPGKKLTTKVSNWLNRNKTPKDKLTRQRMLKDPNLSDIKRKRLERILAREENRSTRRNK